MGRILKHFPDDIAPEYRSQPDAYAPPAVRNAPPPAPRIEQVNFAFPTAARLEYRWLFGDGSTSPWSVPNSQRRFIAAPPAATGCEWRSLPPAEPKPLDLPKFPLKSSV